MVNFATVDFVESKYKEPHKVKKYNFDKFNNGGARHEETKKPRKPKFNPDNIDFDDAETDPVQTDISDSSYLFNNEDAVSFNLNNNNKKQ